MLTFAEFLRRLRSNFVCHDDDRRRLSFSGVDVNNDWRGEEAAAGGDDDNGEDCSWSSPFITKTSSAKSQNFDDPLLSPSVWLLCSFESRFSLATAASYDASLFFWSNEGKKKQIKIKPKNNKIKKMKSVRLPCSVCLKRLLQLSYGACISDRLIPDRRPTGRSPVSCAVAPLAATLSVFRL